MESPRAAGGPLSDTDRNDLLKAVEARQRAVQEKKRELEELRKAAAATPTTTGANAGDTDGAARGGGGGVSSKDLLNGLLESVSQASAAASAKVPVSSIEEGLTSKGGRVDGECAEAALAKQMKASFGASLSLNRQSGIAIVPVAIDRFDKSVQASSAPGLGRSSGSGTQSPLERQTSKVKAEEIYLSQRRLGASPFKSAVRAAVEAVRVAADDGESPSSRLLSPREELTPAAVTQLLSDDEKKRIFSSLGFGEFFDKSTKLVERALGRTETFDILADYSGYTATTGHDAASAETVKKVEVFQDNKWSLKRPVTDVRTSPVFNDLFLCSYGQKKDASIADPDGCVLVWSLQMTKRPEYVFTCQSAVCTALWDSFQPHIIIGGTFTGSVVVWDTRAKTRPVQRSPLSAKGHMHPVYSMEIVGTQHAHNLVSVDTDGRLCLWSLNMLVHPSESIDLKKGSKDSPVSVLCVGFAEGETNTLFGGANDGSIFQAHIHGSKVGISESYEGGHSGPVTSVDWHGTNEGQTIDFSDLLLTTSVDWTVKLWSPKNQSQPIHSFEIAEDYVFDARWHPTHPGVFASADAAGMLDFWDITRDMETPVVRTHTGDMALNKLAWTPDGRKVITGDNDGETVLWGVSQDLCAAKPDDWGKMEEKIEELKQMEATRRVEM